MNNSTIAAISTAKGTGAIGIIRMSGADSRRILSEIFVPSGSFKSFYDELIPRHVYYGTLYDKSKNILDICTAVYFEEGKSYTGEPSAELYCHGGTAVLQSVLNALFSYGAVQAKAGEFTKRAFLNGKIDLFAAEAVIDLINAETEAAAKNAAMQLKNTSSGSIHTIRRKLIELMSEFYADVDFPDEGVPQLVPDFVYKELMSADEELCRLIKSYERGKVIKNGVPVAIIGKPNTGKSSLLNALCGKERAIVTSTEGTTRDVIEERFQYKGCLFRICDTAGIRKSSDEIEQIGIQKSLETAVQADIVLLLLDGSKEISSIDLDILNQFPSKTTLIVINKSDILNSNANNMPDDCIKISAKYLYGIDELCERLYLLAAKNTDDSSSFDTIITNERQKNTLISAQQYIRLGISAFLSGATPDIILTEVEGAANCLGELTGETASDDIVNDIFSRFCVGK